MRCNPHRSRSHGLLRVPEPAERHGDLTEDRSPASIITCRLTAIGERPSGNGSTSRCGPACWGGRLAVRARFRSLRQTPVEHGDSLPEQRRRRAFPRFPLVDDGFPRRAHQRGQLRLAQSSRATNRANLRVVIVWNAGPGQWRATIVWANCPPKVRPPKRPGSGGSRAASEAAKGGPSVIGHRQASVSGRRPQRLDVHPDRNASTGNGRSAWSLRCVANARARARIFGGVARRPASHVRYDSGDTPSMAANAACDFPNAIRHSRSVRGSTTFTPCHRRRPP